MDRMLVVVFDSEAQAYEGKKALLHCEAEGSVSIYGYATLVKHADKTATVVEGNVAGPIGALLGTSLGSLIGLLGGPAGFAVGAASGFTLGGLVDLRNSRVGYDFIDDVARSLTANKVALVAEIDEEWTTPVDTRMEAIGGTVFRRSLSDIQEADIAAMKSDLAQLRAEVARAHARRQAMLQKKIDELEAKLEENDRAEEQREAAAERQERAKWKVLRKNAEAARRAIRELAITPL
ncbi:MAG TPA: DUF1269 domain-containing protein, partial [Thermoanaerobaculia bacterium]